jgi:hypothetical protein
VRKKKVRVCVHVHYTVAPCPSKMEDKSEYDFVCEKMSPLLPVYTFTPAAPEEAL